MIDVNTNFQSFLFKLNHVIKHVDGFRILGNASYRHENLNIGSILGILLETKSIIGGMSDDIQILQQETKRLEQERDELKNKLIILEASRNADSI